MRLPKTGLQKLKYCLLTKCMLCSILTRGAPKLAGFGKKEGTLKKLPLSQEEKYLLSYVILCTTNWLIVK